MIVDVTAASFSSPDFLKAVAEMRVSTIMSASGTPNSEVMRSVACRARLARNVNWLSRRGL
jgi:hypothetical protein